MHIRQANDSDRAKWDDFVNHHPDASPYHIYAWSKAVQSAYKFETFCLLAEDHAEIIGVLPLALIKTPFGKGNLVALPYCDMGGVLAYEDRVITALIHETITLGNYLNVQTIDLRGPLASGIMQEVNSPHREASGKVSMFLELPESSEILWKGFKSKLRSQINKSIKNGLTFFWSQDVDNFYNVFGVNMRDLGSPVHSRQWFQNIVAQYGDAIKVGVVRNGEKTVGAGIILCVKNRISIPWASTLRSHNRLGPNMLLYWNFLQYAADSGAKIFDFGRSTPNEGTYKFKKQWGAQPEPLPWHTIFLRGDIPILSANNSNTRQLAENIWRKLPLGIANFLGAKIRKYISL